MLDKYEIKAYCPRRKRYFTWNFDGKDMVKYMKKAIKDEGLKKIIVKKI